MRGEGQKGGILSLELFNNQGHHLEKVAYAIQINVLRTILPYSTSILAVILLSSRINEVKDV